jgi:hypothetical protein
MAATTNTSIRIAAIALLAALTFMVAASTFAASITQEVQAVKGEAANHISTQGALHQSTQGGASSGVTTGQCGRFCGEGL